MANRFPLIFNSGAGQIQELAASDNLDLTSSNLVNAGILFTSSGSVTAPSLQIGSGTTYNPGLYSPGTDQLAISTNGTGRLFVDASGNVGVGTGSPGSPLDVFGGAIRSTDSAGNARSRLEVFTNGQTNNQITLGQGFNGPTDNVGYLYNRANAALVFGTNDAERMRLTSAGLLGLGTSAPVALLNVKTTSQYASATSQSTAGIFIEQSGGTPGNGSYSTAITLSKINSGRPGAAIASVQTSADDDQLGLAFLTHGSASVGDALVEQVRITHDGKVGIGTTTPSYALDVASADTTAGIGYALRLRQNATAGAVAIQFTDNPVTTQYGYIACDSSSNLKFATGLSERARIDSSGRLLVGTSTALSTGGATPQVQIVGSGSAAWQSIIRTGATTAGSNLVLGQTRGSTGSRTIAQNNDTLSVINFIGDDGADLDSVAAQILAAVDGTPGTNDMPGRLVFSTTADGASSPTERMRIDSAGTTTLTSATSTAPFIAKISSTEVARIDSSGRLLVGTSSARTTWQASTLTPQLQLEGSSANTSVLSLLRTDSSATGARLLLGQLNNSVVAGDGHTSGIINFQSYDGSALIRTAEISAAVDGTPGTNDMPGRLVFSTTADGASTPTERLRITSAGNVGIGTASPQAILHSSAATNTRINAFIQGSAYGIRLGNKASVGASIDGVDNTTGVASYQPLFVNGSTLILGTDDTERARIDSSGRLLVGTSTALTTFFGTAVDKLAIGGGAAPQVIGCYAANEFPSRLDFIKSRSATVNGQTIIQSGDTLAEIYFGGSDGTAPIPAARIFIQVDGTPGTNDMPGRLCFSTTADGASSPTERLRITSAGVLQVADAGNITVGTTTGTKIGTATTQKLGFYNATPVVQPAAVANATTAVDVITQLNDLLAKLRTLGIIAT